MKISGIILAAGLSTRMAGENKLLLPFRGRTVIEETLSNMCQSNISETVIVTGYQHEAIALTLEHMIGSTTRIIFNPDFAEGRSSSIKSGLTALDDTSGAALFMVGDKPTVSHQLINRALDQFQKKQPAILYVETPNGRGHPILFSKKIFNELLTLTGDIVGDDLIENYKNETETIQDDQIQIDIDAINDYKQLVKSD